MPGQIISKMPGKDERTILLMRQPMSKLNKRLQTRFSQWTGDNADKSTVPRKNFHSMADSPEGKARVRVAQGKVRAGKTWYSG